MLRIVKRYEARPYRVPVKSSAMTPITRPSPSISLWRIRQRKATPDLDEAGNWRNGEKGMNPFAAPTVLVCPTPRPLGAGRAHDAVTEPPDAGTLPEGRGQKESNFLRR